MNWPEWIRRSRRVAKFAAVGGSGVVVNAGIFYVLTKRTTIDYRLLSPIAIECAIINNFLWNHLWTWADKKTARKRHVVARLLKFNLSSGLTALVVNWGILILLTEVFGQNKYVANLIGIALGTVINFFVSHFWTFKHYGAPE
ncbi:MAG: GtrA family protein [Chitinivibrionales bacterium]|nr:GtrA family protein [Chitinivibrionales bacterium]